MNRKARLPDLRRAEQRCRAAVLIAMLFSALTGCGSDPDSTSPRPPVADVETPVAHLLLDDVVAAPGGDDSVALYFRALDAYRENVDLVDLRGLFAEQDGAFLGDEMTVAELRNAENEGVSIVVAIDHSNVTADGGALEQTKSAIGELIDHVEAAGWNENALAVVAFANERKEVVPFGLSAADARERLRLLEPDPKAFSAALFDGLDRAIALLRETPDIPRRSLVILISDGRHSLEERDPNDRDGFIQPERRLTDVAEQSAATDGRGRVLIYTIGHPIPAWHEKHIALLDDLASSSGGEYLRTRHPDELGGLLLGVWDDASRSLKAIVPARMDGEPHRLRLRVGRRASDVQIATYPSHFEIGPGAVLAGFGALGAASLIGLVLFLRRPGQLILAAADQSGHSFRLAQGITRIGAAADNDIQLVDASVSAQHALIVINGRTVYVEDQGSAESTFVNGEATQRRALESGDRLRFGTVEARFER